MAAVEPFEWGTPDDPVWTAEAGSPNPPRAVWEGYGPPPRSLFGRDVCSCGCRSADDTPLPLDTPGAVRMALLQLQDAEFRHHFGEDP